MDDFTTVFVFTDKAKEVFGVANRSLWDGILIIAIGVVLLVLFIIQGRKKPPKLVGILFVLAWMVFWFGGSTGWISRGQKDYSRYNDEYQRLLDIYNNQRYKITEGIIQVQHAQRAGGHDTGDIVDIGGVEFEFSYYATTFGYNKTISHGGVLQQGVYARIYYTDEMILRIDMKASNPKSKGAQQLDNQTSLKIAVYR
jgi:hypothetical protein